MKTDPLSPEKPDKPPREKAACPSCGAVKNLIPLDEPVEKLLPDGKHVWRRFQCRACARVFFVHKVPSQAARLSQD